ncbi:MAG: sulfotransferase family 2 domain-containing protein [Bacteroidetes bacterium]|nr:sulfotransferase family 2 domain-containing protein [Bacteroidota bacterium]
MRDNLIFVHIPKTGGTTISTAMTNQYWASTPDFHYRHVIEKTKTSNAGDIFDPQHFEKYKAFTIFMMLRHPIDKLISEYYFFKEREVLMNFFRKKPTCFIDYIKDRQTQNSTINFLKGRRLYDTKIPTVSDLDDVLDAIEQIPVYVGIFEEYEKSMQYFSDITDIKWKKEMEVKRITFKRPSISELNEETKELILEHNKLDIELYQFSLEKFNALKNGLKDPKISFTKDKYTHIVPYVAKTCLFEFCMDNKKFIKQNFEFFKNLTFFLLKKKQIKDGKLFTNIWNQTFINSISNYFPETEFYRKITIDSFNTEDPLEDTIKIAHNLDLFFKENPHNSHVYYTPMQFTESLVVEIKPTNSHKTGFFSQFFKK